MRQKYPLHLRGNESGAISMIVTILIMLLISLIVLAMSQNADTERRQSLDRQLSDQAYYNAESGVNDLIQYLYENPSAGVDHKDDCNLKQDPWFATRNGDSKGSIDGTDGVNKYSCLLYDKAPKTLVFDDIGTSDSKVIPISPVDDAGVPT